MKIGIDIDGVILNTENEFRVKAELYDLLVLHKNGQVNNSHWAQNRYDWTQEEIVDFRNQYLMKASKQSSLMPGAKEVIKLLQQDGHELIIITARGGFIKEMKDVVEERFIQEGLTFNKYYWKIEDKLTICKQEKIDVMIDDRPDICKAIAKEKIRALYFRDVNRDKVKENEYLKEVNTWGEIYRQIHR